MKISEKSGNRRKGAKIDWRRKLSSRKFWAALIGLAAAVMAYAGAPDTDVTRVAAVISAAGVLAAYILAEGASDASGAGGEKIKDPDEYPDQW